jgi:diguanylate cyclase (GGDEF)-like protein
VRVDDVAFRYGGDEFVILVSGGLAGAKLVGERIRKRIESHTFRVLGLKGSAKVQITVSLGLCVMSKGATVESVLNQADQAMFEAKRGSRNALVVA